MKRSLFCFSVAVAAIGAIFISMARAGDSVMEALKKAQQAQLDAPAFRMKMVSTDTGNKTSAMTIELVKPEMLHWKSEENGQVTVEMWSDGKKTYMRQGSAGEIHDSPIDIGSLITQARQSNALETLIAAAKELKFIGHEDVSGTPASVYTFKTAMMGMDSSVKLWISDANSLPLKSEADLHRELKGATINKKIVTSYEYDPSIKIVVPGK